MASATSCLIYKEIYIIFNNFNKFLEDYANHNYKFPFRSNYEKDLIKQIIT